MLRNVKDLRGYAIRATDGVTGRPATSAASRSAVHGNVQSCVVKPSGAPSALGDRVRTSWHSA